MPLIYSTYWSICKKIAKKCQLSSCCFTFIQKLRLRRPLYKPPASSTPPRPHSTTRPPPYAADRFDLGGECIELNQSQCVKIEHYKSSKKSPQNFAKVCFDDNLIIIIAEDSNCEVKFMIQVWIVLCSYSFRNNS